MYLAELRIENFRIFGDEKDSLVLPLRPGLMALVGENDTGKTAVMDAIRFALGTRDQDFSRIEEGDFHQPPNGTPRRTEIRITCKFDGLTRMDIGAFAEYLTYDERSGVRIPVLYTYWKAVDGASGAKRRRSIFVETRSGKSGDGPQLDSESRSLLCATYLRPLRDAERVLSAGRGSRLSQILQHTKEIKNHGEAFDSKKGPPGDLTTLSILGIGDFANALLSDHEGVRNARQRLNAEFLNKLSFSGNPLEGHISVSGSKGDASTRLRQLLEKLDLELRDGAAQGLPANRGLGSNNLLFMACELLLLGSEEDGFPLLLIEEPEAHLHPQRQLRLMKFLQQKANEPRPDDQRIQIIVTTHSPNLASAIDLNSLVLLHRGKAFPLALGKTKLDKSDYGFLSRFLDATKANLFFARGLMIVEGDAENILVPTLARLLGRDFAENGVSIVNVGGTGLRRFARIYQRLKPETDGLIRTPVACIADLDVMPDCAAIITGKITAGEAWPAKKSRRWRAISDFTPQELKDRRDEIYAKASGQCVETFVADQWTLEYDLAFSGLAKEVWLAGHLAKADDQISAGKATRRSIARDALRSFARLSQTNLPLAELASHVYALFARSSTVSKATAAQYLACLLDARQKKGRLTPTALRAALPPYLAAAIDHVTLKTVEEAGAGAEAAQNE